MNTLLKRLADITLSAIAIAALSPILLIIALVVKLDSKGTVLFRQDRLTKGGKVFKMFKFRTMMENAENIGTGLFNFENDFRVTKVGKVLRRTSLDELPQLFNVLRGDMSLVGPRPPVSYELGNYSDLKDEHRKRFTVLPGITGLAQISGRNQLSWEEKIKFDNQYLIQFEKYGILVDFKIIILTIVQVFAKKDIYEVKDSSLEGCSDEEIALKSKDILIMKTENEAKSKGK